MATPIIRDIHRTMAYGPAREADDHALAWLDAHGRAFGHFIGGAFVAPDEEESFEVICPGQGTPLAKVKQGGAASVDAAVAAARAALPGWSRLDGHVRGTYLYAIARHVQKRERLLAVLETMNGGKPIRESRDIDIPLVIRHFYHHAGWAAVIESEFPRSRPVGVCGQIIPWNFPLLMLAWKIAPALAAGNTVVLKPAEYTPLTALAFAEICREVGLPDGVVNIVAGDGATGSRIVGHAGVDKIAFTGSTVIGQEIRRRTAGSGKRLSLELGGKSPFIVFEDADLDSAVEGLVDAIWFNQGQVCCAGSRLLVQEGVAERVHEKVKRRMARLIVGDPLDKSTDIGAIISEVQLAAIRRMVAQGCAEGAHLWQPQIALPEKGLYFPPTLLTDVAPASIVAREEIFGPVLASMSFRTPDEAVALANNTRYGLAASIWSETIGRCLDVATRLDAGVVWVNSTNLFDAASGFGGYKESGFGREGGREGLREYLAREETGPVDPSPEPAARALSPLPGDGGSAADAAAGYSLDRTAKLYIGGRQVRPDSGASFTVADAAGKLRGQAAFGNRKDIRNAVEAARLASGWGRASAHERAQILFYVAENLSARAAEMRDRLAWLLGCSPEQAREEVALALRRIFFYAGFADKFDGAVHATRGLTMTLALHEPWGVVGVVCPREAPLLGLVSLLMPAIAMGNCAVIVPSSACPLLAVDLYQILDTSDLPAGVVNIVTGDRDELAKILAQHDDVAALWYFGPPAGCAMVERESASNLKPTWTSCAPVAWTSPDAGQGPDYLARAVQVKNVWIAYGS